MGIRPPGPELSPLLTRAASSPATDTKTSIRTGSDLRPFRLRRGPARTDLRCRPGSRPASRCESSIEPQKLDHLIEVHALAFHFAHFFSGAHRQKIARLAFHIFEIAAD